MCVYIYIYIYIYTYLYLYIYLFLYINFQDSTEKAYKTFQQLFRVDPDFKKAKIVYKVCEMYCLSHSMPIVVCE